MKLDNKNIPFSESEVTDIMATREAGKSWEDVTKIINKKYKHDRVAETVRKAYSRYSTILDMSNEEAHVKTLKSVARTRRAASATAKENRAILTKLNHEDDVLERIADIVDNINSTKRVTVAKAPKLDKTKKNMTIEVMLSDLHYGKKTETFDLVVARRRMQDLSNTVLAEISRNNKLYNVERIILALLGDIIESATMHGLESARSCEFGNARQVQEAINSIFFDIMLPLARTGLPIDVPAVTGNHDRSETDRTMNNPGVENLTYIIYKTLEMLCVQSGLKNVKFYIPKCPYQVLDIYGNTACYEHFDNSKANTRAALMALLSDRQTQTKKIIDFFRGGHYHETTVYGRGKIIVNGSLPGPDSYSNVKGFESHSDQMINYYIPTKDRPTCYYRSFPVYLK